MASLLEITRSTSRRRWSELLIAALIAAVSPVLRLPRELPRLPWDLPRDWNPLPGLHYFWEVSVPILTGTRWNFSQLDLLPILSPIVTFFYLFALATFIYQRRLAALFLLYPLLLCFLRPSSFSQDLALLIPLLPLLALSTSWFLWEIYRRSNTLAAGFFALIVAVNLYGTLTVERFNRIKTEPNPQLLAFLSENDLHYFNAKRRLVERLVPSVETAPKPAFIAYTDEAEAFRASLNGHYKFRSTTIGQYVIFHEVEYAR